MTAAVSTLVARTRRDLDDDARQLVAVLACATVALMLGMLLMTVTAGGTRTVTVRGVRGAVPTGWIVRQGVGDVLFVASDPEHPSLRYTVSRPGDASGDGSRVVERRIVARGGLLPAFSVLERTTTTVDGRAADQVTFTWAGERPGLPVVSMQGRDLVLSEGGTPLVITLESPTDGFDAALPGFERFAASVTEVLT